MNTKVTSLFTGIGGMDMGFKGNVIVHRDSIINNEFIKKPYIIDDFVELKNHNFEIIFQNDILKGAKEIYNLNETSNIDIYNTKSIYNLLKEHYKFHDSDVVIGGFPCQDFSQCGKRRGFNSNKSHDLKSTVNEANDNGRGTLYKCFVEVIKIIKPKIFVAENVYGLLTMDTNPIDHIIKEFSNCGYDVR